MNRKVEEKNAARNRIGPVVFARAIPLTPALSPGERENRNPTPENLDPRVCSSDSRTITSRRRLFPLLWGEGQGEGKRGALKSRAFNSSSCIRTRGSQCGFTLIELILVLTLLAIVASLAAPSLSRFFRGRGINWEARQLLSLARAGQARAVSAGFPMLLWIDSKEGLYGLQEEGTQQNSNNSQDRDPKAEEFQVGESLHIEASESSPVSVNGRSLPAIRFLPDGTVDENSPTYVRLTADNGDKLWLVQLTNRLNYEVRNTDR
jgi:type IV fimbrial biogenesis protein FimT